MAPVYKLKYFNYMGLAEPIRYLLAYGNVQYEDVVIPASEWTTMQKAIPFGKLPVLEVDNKVVWNSAVIAQYVAKMVGLWPKDDWEVVEMAAVANSICEVGEKIWNWQFELRPEVKAALWKEVEDIVLTKYLADLEEVAMKKGGFFGGRVVNWVDVYFVGIMDFIEHVLNKSVLEKKYPTLYQIYNQVRSVPSIKTYLSKRPAYKF